jgi:putative ABC transport system permease protein
MLDLLNEIRYALRRLRLHPGHTAAVVLTLALGVGLNALIFSLVYGVLFRPLPGFDTSRIVIISEKNSEADNLSVDTDTVKEWRSNATSFEQIEAGASQPVILTGTDLPEILNATFVSAGYFSLYRAKPATGRLFATGEDEPGRNLVAVLDHDFWQQRFSGNPDVIGKGITLNKRTYTIVGVVEPDFHPLGRGQVPVYLPLVPSELRGVGLWSAARLNPGVSLSAARAEMATISARLEASFPEVKKGISANVVPVLETWISQARPVLLILAASVMLVLLLACANVANLMLVRTIDRRKEFAINLALGASRVHLVRQIIVESLLLAFFGGLVGLLLAGLGLKVMTVINPTSIPRLDELHVDGSVVLITFVITLITGIACSLAPLLLTRNQDLRSMLQQEGRAIAGGRAPVLTRRVLLVSELALTYMLVLGAILLVQSFRFARQVNLGYDPHKVLTLRIDSPETTDPHGRELITFYRGVEEHVKHLPGVESVSYTLSLPTGGIMAGMTVNIVGRPPAKSDEPSAVLRVVSPGYLKTLRIPILEGRDFNEQDHSATQPVVIVNESLARKYFGEANPLDQELVIPQIDPNMRDESVVPINRRIIGVVGDVKQNSVTDHGIAEIYLPLEQNPIRAMYMAIRTNQDPMNLSSSVARAVANQGGDVPVSEVAALDQLARGLTDPMRAAMMLFLFLGLLALCLSTVGVYGLVAYLTTLRTREIGIRMVLGAGQRRIFLMVCNQAIWFALIGVLAGAAGYFACYRFLGSFLFGLTPSDLPSMLMVAILLLLVVVLASFIPALRAARVEPAVALRSE